MVGCRIVLIFLNGTERWMDELMVGEPSDDFIWNFILSYFVGRVVRRLACIELVGTY